MSRGFALQAKYRLTSLIGEGSRGVGQPERKRAETTQLKKIVSSSLHVSFFFLSIFLFDILLNKDINRTLIHHNISGVYQDRNKTLWQFLN